MRMREMAALIVCLLSTFLCSSSVLGGPSFPERAINQIEIADLDPSSYYRYSDFVAMDRAVQKKYDGLWSTIWPFNLDSLRYSVTASSTLSERYLPRYIFDQRLETAWVEGVKGNGIGEWLQITLTAEKESPSSTPFSVYEVGLIPGYAKSQATWAENNRAKTALLVVHSDPPVPEGLEWVAYRLHLKDLNKLQYFELDYMKAIGNQDPMKKTVWLRIEDIYPGTKYSDTCISEVVLVGGCLP